MVVTWTSLNGASQPCCISPEAVIPKETAVHILSVGGTTRGGVVRAPDTQMNPEMKLRQETEEPDQVSLVHSIFEILFKDWL